MCSQILRMVNDTMYLYVPAIPFWVNVILRMINITVVITE